MRRLRVALRRRLIGARSIELVRNDVGFGLMELIVSMTLLAILMTLIVAVFSSFTNTFTRERASTDSTNIAGIGMNEVTRVIRSGTILERKTLDDLPIFVEATPESVILYSYIADDSLSPAPIRVRFTIDANRQLVESRWNARRTTEGWEFYPVNDATHPPTSRVVARKIIARTNAEVAAGEARLFTYLDDSGAELATPVGSTNRGNIAAVKVTMNVQADDPGRAEPVELQNRVGLPNLTSSRLGLEG